MDKFKKIVMEHRTAALICLFLLIVFIGGSAMSAVNVAHHRADIAAQQQQQAEEEQKTDEEKQQEKEEADPDLTDTQRKAIDNYDDDTKAFIETLSASVWSANNGTDTLQFTGHTYTETVNGKATEHTYAVTRLEKGTDTAGMEIDTAVFETDTGTHVIRYTCQTGTGEVTDTLSATLSSGTAFQLQDTDYVRQNPVQNITVEGLNDEITALLGGADTLTSELSKWCAAYYPTASTATWNGTVTINYNENTITTAFTLTIADTAPGSGTATVSATYHRAEGTYEFGL